MRSYEVRMGTIAGGHLEEEPLQMLRRDQLWRRRKLQEIRPQKRREQTVTTVEEEAVGCGRRPPSLPRWGQMTRRVVQGVMNGAVDAKRTIERPATIVATNSS